MAISIHITFKSMDLNKVMLIGNITMDPESRTTPQGIAVTTFSVATNLVWTDTNGVKQSRPEYHNVVAWRKLAEICSQYLRKGKKVYIEGRLQTRDWDDQNGVKRWKTEIVADNMIMLSGGPQDGQPFSTFREQPSVSKPESQPASEANETPAKAPSGVALDEEEIRVEDIPF